MFARSQLARDVCAATDFTIFLSHGRQLRCGQDLVGKSRPREPGWVAGSVVSQPGPLVVVAVPLLKCAIFNLENPAMELQGSGAHLGEDMGMRFKVL